MPSKQAISNDGLNWLRYAFAAVTTVLTVARLFVRWRYLKRLQLDDLFYVLAYACFIVCTAFNIDQTHLLLDNFTLQLQLGYVLLFWSTLWLVKASFLAFCWSIFHVSPTFRKFWWAVAIYTFLTYWPIALMRLWRVGVPSDYANINAYYAWQKSPARPGYQIVTSAISLALHTSTELFIFALPAVFIGKLHMSRSKKIAAAAVFAVTVVIIVLGFVRNLFELSVYLGQPLNIRSDFDTVLGSFEPGAAVIVCALPALSVLLPSASSRSSKRTPVENEVSERQALRRQGESGAKSSASASTQERSGLDSIDSV